MSAVAACVLYSHIPAAERFAILPTALLHKAKALDTFRITGLFGK